MLTLYVAVAEIKGCRSSWRRSEGPTAAQGREYEMKNRLASLNPDVVSNLDSLKQAPRHCRQQHRAREGEPQRGVIETEGWGLMGGEEDAGEEGLVNLKNERGVGWLLAVQKTVSKSSVTLSLASVRHPGYEDGNPHCI